MAEGLKHTTTQNLPERDGDHERMSPLKETRLLLAFAFFILLACVSCRPKPGEWHKLAELTNSSAERFVVAQEHFDLAEGWNVGFFFITPDQKLYGSLLQMETLPWAKVQLTETNGTVNIWRGPQLVGCLSLSNRIFKNLLDGSYDNYVEGFDGVQGQPVPTNWFIDRRQVK